MKPRNKRSTNPLGYGTANVTFNAHQDEWQLYWREAQRLGLKLGEYLRRLTLAGMSALSPDKAKLIEFYRTQVKSAMA